MFSIARSPVRGGPVNLLSLETVAFFVSSSTLYHGLLHLPFALLVLLAIHLLWLVGAYTSVDFICLSSIPTSSNSSLVFLRGNGSFPAEHSFSELSGKVPISTPDWGVSTNSRSAPFSLMWILFWATQGQLNRTRTFLILVVWMGWSRRNCLFILNS